MTVVSSTEDTMYQNRSETLSCTKRRQAARLTPANAPKARVTPGSDTREERSVRGVQELLPVIRSRNTAGPANNVRDPLSGAFLPPCCRKLELVTCCARLSVRWYCVSLRCTFSPVCCTAVQQRLAQQEVGNGGGTPRTVNRDNREQFKRRPTFSLKINPRCGFGVVMLARRLHQVVVHIIAKHVITLA